MKALEKLICLECNILKNIDCFDKIGNSKHKVEKCCKDCKEKKTKDIVITKVCYNCYEELDIAEFESTTKGYKNECIKCNHLKKVQDNQCKVTIKFNVPKPAKIQTKVCTCCKVEKDIGLFKIKRSNDDGLDNECTECLSEKKKFRECCRCNVSFHKDVFSSPSGRTCPTCKKNTTKGYYNKNKFSYNARNIVYQSFRRACRGKYRKSKRTEELLGCTILEFSEHLKSLFKEGMTFENHGQCVECWHIDHIIPLVSAITEEDIIKLCHHTNLQPLWSRENMSKGGKY